MTKRVTDIDLDVLSQKFIVALLLVPSLFPGSHFVSIYCHIPVHADTLTFIMKEHS